MGIFEKLFGKQEKEAIENKPDIDQLITSEDINSSIIELDNHIASLCDYGDNLDRLNNYQKVFFYNQSLEREINNGGFNQFYFNSSGDYAHEVIASLRKIGAEKTADLVKEANDQFPNQIVPKNREERQTLLEQIQDSANEIWDDLDQKFYSYEEDLNLLNMEFIRSHKHDFM